MSGLYMIECHLDQTALMRFLKAQGLDGEQPYRGPDLGYGVHAWLKAAFGDLAPRPWRLLAGRRRPLRVLGYAKRPAEDLVARMEEFADPQVQTVCAADGIAGKAMPRWTGGRKLGFELLCCPVGRKSRDGTEKDLFLLKADHAGADERLEREAVYADWTRERIERAGAATVLRLRLTGFRRVHQQRKAQVSGGKRRVSLLERPEALISGVLCVGDPEAFAGLLARGVGRHRAFGYGMLLLKPPGG